MSELSPSPSRNGETSNHIKYNVLFSSTSKLAVPSIANPTLPTGEPTTAINLENAGPSESSFILEEDDHHLQVVSTSRHSVASDSSYPGSGGQDSEYEEEDGNNVNSSHIEEEALQNMLSDLIRSNRLYVNVRDNSLPLRELSFLDLNIFPNTHEAKNELEFYEKHIQIQKDNDEPAFHQKLKHFFILSTAGKPIFSMHGSDDLIMGYMGIITTIVCTFEESMKEDFKSIMVGDKTKIVVLNKSPLLLVAISQISYELMSSNTDSTSSNKEDKESDSDDILLINQLNTLYKYLLAILSKPTIEKNFHNRMNYDLRKVLTPLDFQNLEALCMKLTYGLPLLNQGESISDTESFDFFIGELMDSSIQSVKVTNTTRMKLNNILLSCKRLKLRDDDSALNRSSETASLIFNRTTKEAEKYLGDDLLFSFLLASSNKILNYMKPKNHSLSNEDMKLLFSMISAAEYQNRGGSFDEDLWIPLCLPNFNPNGFLYVFVKKISLSSYLQSSTVDQYLTIVLVSSNKNTFFQMRELSRFIINKIVKREQFLTTLTDELTGSTKLSILNDIKVPAIKHFIYKLKETNQFIMNDMVHFNNDRSMNTLLQLVYFYSILHNSRATRIKSKLKSTYNQQQGSNFVNPINTYKIDNKKLTYVKWQGAGSIVTGFMLSDNSFEFYCLSNEEIDSKELISSSLKIIRWCEKYRKRLFLGGGVVF